MLDRVFLFFAKFVNFDGYFLNLTVLCCASNARGLICVDVVLVEVRKSMIRFYLQEFSCAHWVFVLVIMSCFFLYVFWVFSFFLSYLFMIGISFGISVLSDFLACG